MTTLFTVRQNLSIPSPLAPSPIFSLSLSLCLSTSFSLSRMKMQVSVAAIALSVVLGVTVVLACRVLNGVWLRPKRLERRLREQGFTGNPYRLLLGDWRENMMMLKQASSKPINITDDILPRTTPLLCQTVKNYGKNSFIWVGPRPKVTVMDPELIKDVFNRFNDFHKPTANPLGKLLVAGLVSYEGEKWVKHRRIINPAFHLEKLKNMVPAFHQSCSDMISKWKNLVSVEGSCELDVWPFLMNLSCDVISRTAFGSSYEEGKRIFQLLQEIGKLAFLVAGTAYIPGGRFLPTKNIKSMKKIDQEIRVALRRIISKREKAMKDGEVANDDLLGILLESNFREIQEDESNNNTVGMSMEEVIEECKLFYLAGQETTSVLLVWTMVLLARHTNWQSRAREEVLQLFGNCKPDFDRLNHLKIVTMILYEVLRLYPPVVELSRSTPKETKLGNFTLPAGVLISLPVILVHHDHELWGDDAEEFKPERFSEGILKATKNQTSFFPLGGGPRICIGQNFALIEVKMALAMILQHFSFELSPSYTHAPQMIVTLHPQHGAHLILHKL